MKYDMVDIEKMAEDNDSVNHQIKQFVDKIESDNETLFAVSEKQVKNFYMTHSNTDLVKHFTSRMVNERMNMVELAKQIANSDAGMDPKELQLLSKQALDEANHFRKVKDVVEHLNGGPINIKEFVEYDSANNSSSKGAKLIQKYNCDNDEMAMALYQFICEGRAARNWFMMSTCVTDPFIANTYARIARDEKFHSKIGRRKLMQLCDTPEKQERAMKIANAMRIDLYEINCSGSGEMEGTRELIEKAYGKAEQFENSN